MKTKNIIQNLAICSILLIACLCCNPVFAQIAISTDGEPPDESAMLEVKSTSKGLLMPRMTQAEIIGIPNPANGLIVYSTDDSHFYFFDAVSNRWNELAVTTVTINVGCGTVTDADGNTYNTVMIYSQCWMTENLATTKYNDGTDIPLVTDNYSWYELTTPGYCWYDNDQATNSDYGALYNGYTVNTGNLCPIGWHVPTDDEWATLTSNLGGTSVAGGKLKENGLAHWNPYNVDATNESGFTGIPGGFRSYGFGSLGEINFSWSSTPYWGLRIFGHYGHTLRITTTPNMGYSVRCLKD